MNKKSVLVNVIIMSIIVIILLIIIIELGKKTSSKNEVDVDRKITNQETINDLKNSDLFISDNQINTYSLEKADGSEPFEEMSEFFEGTTNKVVLYVNGEEVTDIELALENYHQNNSVINANEEMKNFIDSKIEKVVICQDANNKGFFVSDKEVEKIKSIPKYEEDMRKKAKKLNMSYEECEQMYIKSQKMLYLELKWQDDVIPKIHSGEIRVNTEEYAEIYEKYIDCVNNTNFKKALELGEKMLDLYKEYLVEQASIEYVN